MKEKISFIIDDLNDYDKTMQQLFLLFEKILYYYSSNNLKNFIKFVQSCVIYFYQLNTLIDNSKEEKNE